MTRVRSARQRLAIPLLMVVALSACAPRTTSGAQMADANRLYEAGRYSEAAAAYQVLADGGVEDGTLYYNLGNAYFKAGDLGRAILNYRRAQLLLPRDGDVASNLQVARAQTRDRLDADDGGALVALARRTLVESTTLDEAAAVAMGLWVLLCALVAVALLWPRARQALRYGIAVVAMMLATGVLSVGIRVLEARAGPPAVIVAEEVAARSGPGTEYLTEFSLHVGAEVRVMEQHDDWLRISLPGDLQGWVPGGAVDVP